MHFKDLLLDVTKDDGAYFIETVLNYFPDYFTGLQLSLRRLVTTFGRVLYARRFSFVIEIQIDDERYAALELDYAHEIAREIQYRLDPYDWLKHCAKSRSCH